ncbi:MAG TPA: DUF4426 domain-containing protein [Gammaproteobacteria bacterium]|nr:DUF4426 domain-containing protein [Gammaproteobacteria bacterium]
MTPKNTMILKLISFLLPLLLFIPPVQADSTHSQDLGDYVVHYNALPTEVLQADIARQYGITRSKFRGFITVSIIKKTASATGKPVKAKISVSARNLNDQNKMLSLRQIEEGSAIYYVDDFRVANLETLNFKLTIRPENSHKNFTVNFRQQFFTNPP